MSQSYENLLVEVRDGVSSITLNRPKKYNALDTATLRELRAAFAAAEADDAVAAVVLSGSPEAKRPAFAAGADISEMSSMGVMALREHALFGQSVLDGIAALRKPVLAAVNGLALGGGLELAMACHLRWAAEEAVMGQPEINLGLTPGFGGTQRLPRLVGRGPALEMLLSGDTIDAQRALALGLVTRVLPQKELMEQAMAFGAKLAAKAPIPRRLILELVADGEDRDLATAQRLEADRFGILASTQDTEEGLSAFLEKRKPKWSGR